MKKSSPGDHEHRGPVHDRVRPDCALIHRELKRDGVTLQLLWEEYVQVYPVLRDLPPVGAAAAAVDAGRCIAPARRRSSTSRGNGRRWSTGTPGNCDASSCSSPCSGPAASPTSRRSRPSSCPTWVGAHTRMVEYFGGSTTLWVPDQLKSAVTRPCRYEPGVNRTYEDLAAHYGAVVIPARPRNQRDKSRRGGRSTPGTAVDTRPAPQRDVLQPRRPGLGDPRPPRRERACRRGFTARYVRMPSSAARARRRVAATGRVGARLPRRLRRRSKSTRPSHRRRFRSAATGRSCAERTCSR